MSIDNRAYRDREDLNQIGRLVRRAHALASGSNAWSFARFDIWAQRRLGDKQVQGKQDWQRDIRLWVAEPGDLAGAVLFANDHSAVLVYDPGRREIVKPMLGWSEARYRERGRTGKPLSVEAMASNAFLEQSLRARDYTRPEEHYIQRQKLLADTRTEPVLLPGGFYVKSIESTSELRAFHKAVEVIFKFEDSVDVYRILQQAPSYIPELDLILLSPTGEIAAFCTVWLDKDSRIAEFEPVGTMPEYRKQGLGAALLAEASNRLRSAGCKTASVFSWSESAAANRLYARARLEAQDRLYAWQWQGT